MFYKRPLPHVAVGISYVRRFTYRMMRRCIRGDGLYGFDDTLNKKKLVASLRWNHRDDRTPWKHAKGIPKYDD